MRSLKSVLSMPSVFQWFSLYGLTEEEIKVVEGKEV
jgi:hypothetical protein